MKKKLNYLILLITIISMVGCTNVEDASDTDRETDPQEVTTVNTNSEKEETNTTDVDVEETPSQQNNELFSGYKLIEVDGGDLSGYREPNVVVDIGYGEREYWAFTNVKFRLVRLIG